MLRTLLLILIVVLGMALLSVEQDFMPLVLDLVVVFVEWIADASFVVIGPAILLVVLVGTGAWVTVVGIRMDAKPPRMRSRRRSRA